MAEVIRCWFEERAGRRRPVNVMELWEHLVAEYGYGGSYRSVLRYVREHYPKPKIRTYRRVETPPGAQVQTDWAEYPGVDVGKGTEPLNVFWMVLSHSRMPAAIWSRRQNQVSWLSCHNEAFRRLRGIPAVNRIDNVKTALSSGAGAWGVIHPTYRSYARAVGFHVDACPPRQPQAKGKAEAKVRLGRRRVDPGRRSFAGFEELQAWTDERIADWSRGATCPATGHSVRQSWQEELEVMRPLPLLPEPFDVAVTRRVGRDCLVAFEGRQYAVPFAYAERRVEVRGCAGIVQIWADGEVLKEYPRHTWERLLMRANVRSVAYRYDRCAPDDLPGPKDQTRVWSYQFRPIQAELRADWAISCCDCLRYQSCEVPDYRESLAWAVTEAIREDAIQAVTEDAPWGISEGDLRPAAAS